MKRKYITVLFPLIILISLSLSCSPDKEAGGFKSDWKTQPDRIWVGPDFWANRLQDWRLQNGRLECLVDSAKKPMRTVHLLTGRLEEKDAAFSLQVRTGPAIDGNGWSPGAATGFLVGAGKDLDYRAAALIHHAPGPGGGLFFGIDAEGRLFIRDNEESNTCLAIQDDAVPPPDDVVLHLDIQPGVEGYSVRFESRDGGSGKILGRLFWENTLPADRLAGSLALVSHPGESDTGSRFWFSEWVIVGDKFTKYPDRNCGPIISTQYTVDRNILKLTAQIMPLAQEKKDQVKFQTRSEGQWVTRAECDIADYAYTATFRIEGWDDTTDTPYRVFFKMPKTAGQERIFTREGIIRHNPVDKKNIVIAAFTGNHNAQSGVDGKEFPWSTGLWFPHPDIIRHASSHRPDVLFFSGDQVYEGASPTAADFSHPFLDYLYKWYLWCWAFRDLTTDIPSVIEPDDHDVFHGNLWGVGGKTTEPGKTGAEAQDSGGYKLSPAFVNMVERTQTSHLPDPFDPTPVQQGIGVYYCALNWGGVSFAVIEDRKFKSAPKPLLPEAEIWNGWYQNEGFNPKTEADVTGAKLLGDRQLDFLARWTADWSDGVWMKVVLSQTLFSNVATLPAGSKSGSIIPGLPFLKADEYAENDQPVADMDSNGWPQTGRNEALRRMRQGFAAHISGDQHLGSTIQYGIDDWRDAGFALCVPSVANFWPRRWYPNIPGKNRKPGSPRYTGDFEDGFGNKMTVFAVSNPSQTNREPVRLHDRAPGYGIARFNRITRECVFENWPRGIDPTQTGASPYPGWPVRFHQEDSDGRKPAAWLPPLQTEGMALPVIQIIEERTGEILYTIRPGTNPWQPGVFQKGRYTIKIGEPGTDRWKILEGIKASQKKSQEVKRIVFSR